MDSIALLSPLSFAYSNIELSINQAMPHEKVGLDNDHVLSTTPPKRGISGLLTPPATTEQRPSDNKASASRTALRLLMRHLYRKLSPKDISLKLTLTEY